MCSAFSINCCFISPSGPSRSDQQSALDISGETRRDRIKLDCYLNIVVFTGMRPTALKNLNWGDLHLFNETVGKSLEERLVNDIVIRASGKKNKHSNIVAMKSVRPFFEIEEAKFGLGIRKSPLGRTTLIARLPTGTGSSAVRVRSGSRSIQMATSSMKSATAGMNSSPSPAN